MTNKSFFTWKWLITSLLAVTAVAVMVRLGFWQLDRLEQRRAFNARVEAQLEQPPLKLNQALNEGTERLASSMYDMEYRSITVVGEYDHVNQVALRNQAWNSQLGVRLLTPLHIDGSDRSILVDRGWAPYEDFLAGELDRYAETGRVEVQGVIRRSQTRPDLGFRSDPTPAPGDERQTAFFLANVEQISQQVPYPLLPVYIQQLPDPAFTGPPHRSELELTLTEGSHLGYAIQWFTFAALLGVGYPVFVSRELKGSK